MTACGIVLDFAQCISTSQYDHYKEGPSQPPPFLMPSKLFTLLVEPRLYCFSASCVPEGMFDYL